MAALALVVNQLQPLLAVEATDFEVASLTVRIASLVVDSLVHIEVSVVVMDFLLGIHTAIAVAVPDLVVSVEDTTIVLLVALPAFHIEARTVEQSCPEDRLQAEAAFAPTLWKALQSCILS